MFYDCITINLCLQNSLTTQNDVQEPSISNKENPEIEIQNKQTTTSTYFDAEGIYVELKNEEHTSSVKVNYYYYID